MVNYILGTGLSHDGSSCLLRDGEIVVAIEKERLTREKHDGFSDAETLQYCLDAAGLAWSDVDLLVQNRVTPLGKDEKIEFGRLHGIPLSVPVVNISHHLAHAYSVAGYMSFAQGVIVIVDGRGDAWQNCLANSERRQEW